MKVRLMQYTPDPQRVVAMAARLCYSPIGAEELAETMTDAQVEKLVKKIIELGHTSTLEHASFTFAIEGVSRTLTHQLVRHRIASYSQQSQRYVAEHDFEYILPPTVAANDEAKEKFESLMDHIRRTYDELVALGVEREDARYVLSNATETKIVVTMNARALQNFFYLRCCNRAQWEIREMARQMLMAVREVAPLLFEKSGPGCVSKGFCSEGKMTCGKMKEVQALYQA